jgi:2-keto-4-pentenoate hydratase
MNMTIESASANDSAIASAVEALLGAHRNHVSLAALPPAAVPDNIAAAYRIQSAFAAAYPAQVAGYKIGAASPQSRALVGADRPFVARVFADTLFTSPATIPPGRFFTPGVEAELAFRLACDLAPRPGGYDRVTIAAAIAAVHPAIEICDNRFTDWRTVGLPSIIADNGFYGALVLGTAIPDWRERDLGQIHATMVIEGVTRGAGTCQPVLGDPIESVAWLANRFGEQGVTVGAGAVIAIGTWTGLFTMQPGQRCVAAFAELGEVQISF